MDALNTAAPGIEDRQILSVRTFDAPRELVWKAWTTPDIIAQWWGPKGFTITTSKMDVRPGGTWEFVMHGPDGKNYPNTNVFVELTEPERIVIDHVVSPLFRLTATFEDLGVKTRLNFQMTFETADVCARVMVYAVPSNEELFDKLAAVLKTIGEN